MCQFNGVILSFILIVVIGGSTINNTNNEVALSDQAIKALMVRKLKKNYKKLKKQEGALKLYGGMKGVHEGNVEILHEGKWGSICDDEWDYLEANIVCRQLGFEAAINVTTNGFFGQARRRYWMDNIFCDGTELELANCRFDGWGKSDCDSSEAAGVICLQDEDDFIPLPLPDHQKVPKIKIKEIHTHGIAIRLNGGRTSSEGRVEIKLGHSDWGTVCGDGWSLFEANVICRQLGLGYASFAMQANLFSGQSLPIVISGIKCNNNERNLIDCFHDRIQNCPGKERTFATVMCSKNLADLVLDHVELMRTAHLEDRPLYWLQCAMEENCVASQAYKIQKESDNWHLETRRLLRFTAKIMNVGTADFRPIVPKHLWEWHMCHMHYHSMEVFATFDIIDTYGNKVAEGHKASFCLEDNQCNPGVVPKYKCANYGDQGISVNCSDIYKYSVDCQWVDISELSPGQYTMKVAVNPEYKVGEMSFDNNAAVCELLYTERYATVHNCIIKRP